MKHTLSLLTALLLPSLAAQAAEPPLNVLLITADDLGYEAMDFLDGKVPGVTPNLSKLASESLSFQHGFVNAAICCPSRSIIATGRYGHNSGLFGFNKRTDNGPVFDPNDPAVRVEKPEKTDEARDAKSNFKDWERPKMT
jgi:N-sulfoglucosamine sulfohydrolase